MGWVTRFAKSSVGAKWLMAITGVVLVVFVIVHMLGNLQVFLGQDEFNAYAAFLKGTPALLWTTRIGLLVAVVLHAGSGMRLARLNRKARPQAYAKKQWLATSVFARTMAFSGVMLAAFIVYHLLHFTLGVTHPQDFHRLDPLGRHDVYTMFVLGFRHPAVTVTYVAAMVMLGFHLAHGISSLFQSLGLNHPKYNGLISRLGPLIAALLVFGNVLMPIAVVLGFITLPGGGN